MALDVELYFRIYASKFASWRHPVEDLIQEMRIGYWQAQADWKPDGGASLVSYCIERAKGRVRHFVRDKANLIRIPAYRQERGESAPDVVSFAAFEDDDFLLGRRDFVPFLIDVLERESPDDETVSEAPRRGRRRPRKAA